MLFFCYIFFCFSFKPIGPPIHHLIQKQNQKHKIKKTIGPSVFTSDCVCMYVCVLPYISRTTGPIAMKLSHDVGIDPGIA